MIFFRLFCRNIGSFSLHTKTPYDHMVCHDFDPRTFCILKGTGRKWAKFVFGFFFIVWKTCIECSEFTLRLLITRGCVMNLTQGQVCNVKENGKKNSAVITFCFLKYKLLLYQVFHNI